MGFLMGFSHTGLLMLQSGLMYTTAHKNKYWRFVLESWVFVHASTIAIQTLPGWQMFFFGFLLLVRTHRRTTRTIAPHAPRTSGRPPDECLFMLFRLSLRQVYAARPRARTWE